MDWCFYSFPILMLLHRCCCLSLNVASACNSPIKMNHFFYCRSLQLVTKQGVFNPLWCFHSSFDVASPPLMLLLPLLCCHSCFNVATSPWGCASSIQIDILSLMFLLLIYVTAPPLRLPLHLQCPWKYESRIQYLGSKIRGLGSRIQDDQSMSCILLI